MSRPGYIFLVLLAWCGTSLAAGVPHRMVTIRSGSDQFVVYGPRPDTTKPGLSLVGTNQIELRLDADMLAISAERIKQAVLAELNLIDAWEGRISLAIEPYALPDQDVRIVATVHPDGWRYQVDLPERIPPEKMVRALVRVILQEISNRFSRGQSAEIPLWLAEGLAAHLLASAGNRLVLAPETSNVIQFYKPDPHREIREYLSTNSALSFAQLSLPTPDLLSGKGGKTYSMCAQLFYTELTNLKGGKIATYDFLQFLTFHLNWETAFLQAFAGRFRSLLEVEKWWAVVLADTTGRNPIRVWPLDVSLKKLDETLTTPAQMSKNPQQLPQRTLFSLQQVVTQWNPGQQQFVLRQKISQLFVLRANFAPEIVKIADDYRETLAAHLGRFRQIGYQSTKKGVPPLTMSALAEETVKKLDSLDRQRAAIVASNTPPQRVNGN